MSGPGIKADIAILYQLIEDNGHDPALVALGRLEKRLESALSFLMAIERAERHGNLSEDIEDALEHYRHALGGSDAA